MSAEQSARSISDAEGVDRVRALQRVLYAVPSRIPPVGSMPCSTTSPAATSWWRAWGHVAANRGAPGVDGVILSMTSRTPGGGVPRSPRW